MPGHSRWAHRTLGPPPIGFREHKYDLRRLTDGRAFWSYRITPDWPVAGFVRPRQ